LVRVTLNRVILPAGAVSRCRSCSPHTPQTAGSWPSPRVSSTIHSGRRGIRLRRRRLDRRPPKSRPRKSRKLSAHEAFCSHSTGTGAAGRAAGHSLVPCIHRTTCARGSTPLETRCLSRDLPSVCPRLRNDPTSARIAMLLSDRAVPRAILTETIHPDNTIPETLPRCLRPRNGESHFRLA